ncbi:MAG: S9 family peptidase, partial [Bacteroidetes bacterium]|nr:S9 family peptidase [Bacteroidota bacterium]
MKRSLLLFFIIVIYGTVLAQKKPLDHSVYDGWQHIGERMISNDGKWIVYTIEPQQGDNELVIQSSDAIYKKTIARGYNAVITEDSRYAIFKIKPFFKDTREAKIKKKKPEEFPKDSFAIVELGKESVWKLQRVKSYKTPEHASGWVAYQLEKKIELPAKVKAGEAQKKVVDSLNRVIDSLNAILESIPKRKSKKRDDDNWQQDADTDEPGNGNTDTGSDLILCKLENGKEVIFSNTVEYYFSRNGRKLLVEEARNPKDSLSKALVLLYDLYEGLTDTLSRGGNDFRNFTMDDEGMQVAYAAERDAAPKDLLKFYRLWYYKEGMDSAALLVDKNSAGMDLGMTISENATLHFSKSGQRLFFGTVPLPQPKDTTLVDFEHPKVDIWHYNDDYLQTVQLKRLQNDLKKSYQAVYDFTTHTMLQLGSEQLPQVMETSEGDGEQFVGVTDYGKRIESQWTGNTLKDVYAIDVKTGSKKLVKENLDGIVFSSSTGRYIMWYDLKARNYFVWNG